MIKFKYRVTDFDISTDYNTGVKNKFDADFMMLNGDNRDLESRRNGDILKAGLLNPVVKELNPKFWYEFN